MSVTGRDVIEAAQAIRGAIVETPCLFSRTLSEISGARIFVKFESGQFTASFKDRGALAKLLSLQPKERARGVVAMSAGNHAQAVAYHAQRMAIPATIVMPRFTPTLKVEQTRGFGADVVLHGDDLSEAAARTSELIEQRNLVLVHPYDDEHVIAGQGTVGLEMLEQQPEIEMLVAPVGGGGLLAGIALAARELRPEVEVIGVEAERYPSMQQCLEGRPIECGSATIAEGIAVKEPGRITREIIREHSNGILLVDEAELERAVLLLLEVEKTVAEGAGAAALAAVLAHPARFAGRSVGLVLSGGNIDLFVLSSIIQRGLVRSARLARLRVAIPDRPGALAAVSTCISRCNASIVEVHHQRSFTHLPLESAEVVFVLQTRGPDHLQQVIDSLEAGGFKPEQQPGLPPR